MDLAPAEGEVVPSWPVVRRRRRAAARCGFGVWGLPCAAYSYSTHVHVHNRISHHPSYHRVNGNGNGVCDRGIASGGDHDPASGNVDEGVAPR